MKDQSLLNKLRQTITIGLLATTLSPMNAIVYAQETCDQEELMNSNRVLFENALIDFDSFGDLAFIDIFPYFTKIYNLALRGDSDAISKLEEYRQLVDFCVTNIEWVEDKHVEVGINSIYELQDPSDSMKYFIAFSIVDVLATKPDLVRSAVRARGINLSEEEMMQGIRISPDYSYSRTIPISNFDTNRLTIYLFKPIPGRGPMIRYTAITLPRNNTIAINIDYFPDQPYAAAHEIFHVLDLLTEEGRLSESVEDGCPLKMTKKQCTDFLQVYAAYEKKQSTDIQEEVEWKNGIHLTESIPVGITNTHYSELVCHIPEALKPIQQIAADYKEQ